MERHGFYPRLHCLHYPSIFHTRQRAPLRIMAPTSPLRLSLWALPFASTVSAIPATHVPRELQAQFQGCYTEPPRHEGRALKAAGTRSDDMTNEKCAAFCSDYKFFGTEYSRECYCGNALAPNTLPADGDCTMACAGDETQICGAGDRLSIYLNPAYVEPVVATVPDWNHIGCVVDKPGDRVLSAKATARDDMTPQACASICKDYEYFGVEFGRECYCGRSFLGEVVGDEQCTRGCSGDPSVLCGDGDRLNVYSSAAASSYPESVGDYRYIHCGADSPTDRVLKGAYTSAADMTIEKCAASCSEYTYFGLEYGRECFCGNSYTGVEKPKADCHYRCSGDGSQICGGSNRISVYDSTPLPPPNPGPGPICGKIGLCTKTVPNVVSLGLRPNEARCRAAADRNSALGIKSFQYSLGLCFGLPVTLTECEFSEFALGGSVHADLSCPA